MKKIKFDVKKFMVYFIAFIMVSSVFGVIFFGFRQEATSLKYNNIKFVRENNQWSAVINNKKMFFDYYPEEIESINVSSEIIERLKGTYEIDATSDVNSSFKDTIALVEYSMSRFLDDNLNIYLRIGFTTDNDFNLPIIKCPDVTDAIPIIYFGISNTTSIDLENDCIMAKAKNDPDFIRIKDRLIYGILGVMQ